MNINGWDSAPDWDRTLWGDLNNYATSYRDINYQPFCCAADGTLSPPPPRTPSTPSTGTLARPVTQSGKTTIQQTLAEQQKLVSSGAVVRPISKSQVSTLLQATRPDKLVQTPISRVSAPAIVTGGVGGGGGGGPQGEKEEEKPTETPSEAKKGLSNAKKLGLLVAAVGGIWYFTK